MSLRCLSLAFGVFKVLVPAVCLGSGSLASEYFRLSTTSNEVQITLSDAGWLLATNYPPSSPYVVERSRLLETGTNDWQPFTRGTGSNQNLSIKVMDPNVPPGMCFIPGGTFEMGDSLGDYQLARPVHTVTVSPFFLRAHEVTVGEFASVLQWGYERGLFNVKDDHVHDSKGTNIMELGRVYSEILFNSGNFTVRAGRTNFPVSLVSWYGAVTYCNLVSEQQGYEPCYDLTTWSCDFSKNGYRLPTEAEWEFAARAGYEGLRFPWPDTDTITHARANYRSSTNNWYDISPTRGFHPDYSDTLPRSSPVGSFAPNNYGLYDTSGNVWEWVWDWADRYPSTPQVNPLGPSTGTRKVFRGGAWMTTAERVVCAARYNSSEPESTVVDVGFRVLLPCKLP